MKRCFFHRTIFPSALWLLAAGAGAGYRLAEAGAAPRISEFLASNPGPERDGLGQTSDWIEIFNPDAEPVDLSGWSLTDDADVRGKWMFPAVTLEPGRYLVVRASGRDLREPGSELHTNFSLSAGGEFLALYPPGAGAAVSQWDPYPKQFPGYSHGRLAEEGSVPVWMATPTPGAVNSGDVLTDYVRDTVFDAARGFLSGPVTVQVTTATPGASVRYTLDGSEPQTDDLSWPAGGLTVNSTAVLRVRAFHAGMVPTNVDTRTFILPATWVAQPEEPAGFPRTWGSHLMNGTLNPNVKVLADYGMNPLVTADPGITAALTSTLPVLCVTGTVPEIFGQGGIMSDGRYGDTERQVSVEYFNPADPADRFSARASLQAHGGGVKELAKKAFRLDFTGAYGDGELKHPLFAGSVSERFDQLVLRPGGHDSFTVTTRGTGAVDQYDLAGHATYLRDQFLRRTENRLGLVSPRGRYVHLCLNGLYWGVYDLHERPNARYAAGHSGGQEQDWDVLHHHQSGGAYSIVDGNADEWLNLLATTQVAEGPEALAAARAEVGGERFTDHLIVRIWAADFDWLGPATIPGADGINPTGNVAWYQTKNWYAMKRTRGEAPLPWQFFTWDAEISMGNHILSRWAGASQLPENFSWPVPQRLLTADFTGISREGTPAQLWAALAGKDAEFRLRVADRLRRHFFNGGVLSPAVAQAAVAEMEQELDAPMLAESARWGDASNLNYESRPDLGGVVRSWKNPLLTREAHWRPEVAWLRDTFAVQRGMIVLSQFRARGLYPAVEPSDITPFGGALPEGGVITLTSPETGAGGVIHYTLDGGDPRVPVTGAVAPGALTAGPDGKVTPPEGPLVLKARVLKGGVWSALTEAAFSAAAPPDAARLAITEIHYHPPDPSAEEMAAGFTSGNDFEFLEITNRSAGPVAVDSLRFAAGVDFDFAAAGLRELAAGASLLIASHAAAFEMRYGFAPDGVFTNGTRLSNGGERLKLTSAGGQGIMEVEYGDGAGWPEAADGQGKSLHLLAPLSGSDGAEAAQWRAAAPGPGTLPPALTYAEWVTDYFSPAETADPALAGPLADPDADGLPNMIEYLTVSHPRRSSPPPLKAPGRTAPDGGGIRYEWPCRADATGYTGGVEVSGNLSGWAPPGAAETETATTKGVVLRRLDIPEETVAEGGFARLRVQAAAP